MLDDQHSDDCCSVGDQRIARHFDERVRENAAAAESGFPEMVAVTEELLELLADVAEARPTVLELGSGSGALAVALLERGAAAAEGVDLSPESVATAQRRAEAAGMAERATFSVGDAVAVPFAPGGHDWVVIDRVICCYPHVGPLLANAIAAAGRRVAFSMPESAGWRGLVTRFFVLFENATDRFRARPCPNYIHDVRKVEARLSAAGFARLRDARVGMWYLAVWERAS